MKYTVQANSHDEGGWKTGVIEQCANDAFNVSIDHVVEHGIPTRAIRLLPPSRENALRFHTVCPGMTVIANSQGLGIWHTGIIQSVQAFSCVFPTNERGQATIRYLRHEISPGQLDESDVPFSYIQVVSVYKRRKTSISIPVIFPRRR